MIDLFTRKDTAEPDRFAVLDAEIIWLVKTGALAKIYREHPNDFDMRSHRIEKAVTWRIARTHPHWNVVFVSHAHLQGVSFCLQMDRGGVFGSKVGERWLPLPLAVGDKIVSAGPALIEAKPVIGQPFPQANTNAAIEKVLAKASGKK